MNSALCYNVCTIGYVAALFLYIFNLAMRRALVRRIATVVVALSFITQTIGMVFRWLEAGAVEVAAVERTFGTPLDGVTRMLVYTQHPPWSNLYEIMVYMSWGMIFVFLITEVKWRIRFLGIFALLLALTALGVASLTDGTIKPLVPALKSWWIMVHVISASVAYAAGSLGAVASFLYLLKAKERATLSSVAAGTMFMTAFLGIILGRGWMLLSEGVYKVKIFREYHGELIAAGKVIDGKLEPIYATSPYVGIMLIASIAMAIVSFMMLIKTRREHDVPVSFAKASYIVAFAVFTATMGLIVYNNLTIVDVKLPPDIAQSIMPPAPWRLSMKSNTWDFALFGIIWIIQLFMLFAILLPKGLRDLLPDARKLDQTAYQSIVLSFVLVAVVLVTGALWAHYAWGRYWGWDPKETGALMIWLTYALYLHTRITYGWSGSKSAMIGIIGFFVILAGFLGVNLGWFADGLHSYGSS